MNQRSPLLKHRIKSENEVQQNITAEYDYIIGMWVDNGVPLVKSFLDDSKEVMFGDTIITATREGIDKSESSSSIFGQTGITETREAIDQSERVTDSFTHTTVTETREATDQSEKSV